jgi:hypothetical protein
MGLTLFCRRTTASARAHCCKGPAGGSWSYCWQWWYFVFSDLCVVLSETPSGVNPMSVN